MRIGANILLADGYCYQSYGWNQFRPLGKLQNVIDFLEKYQCDEIVIIRPVRKNDSLEIFKKDINTLKGLNCMTPLSFGGGLRSNDYIDMLHDLPIERLVFSSSFIEKDYSIIEYAIKLYGRQAIQCLLPFKFKKESLEIFFSKQDNYVSYTNIDFDKIDALSNEIILLDTVNEGTKNAFNHKIFDILNINNSKLIISGGIGKESISYAKKKNMASVIIENRILHNEYSVKEYKSAKKM
jgi:imidazole glycerol phosphate synthase subunit HisF